MQDSSARPAIKERIRTGKPTWDSPHLRAVLSQAKIVRAREPPEYQAATIRPPRPPGGPLREFRSTLSPRDISASVEDTRARLVRRP